MKKKQLTLSKETIDELAPARSAMILGGACDTYGMICPSNGGGGFLFCIPDMPDRQEAPQWEGPSDSSPSGCQECLG